MRGHGPTGNVRAGGWRDARTVNMAHRLNVPVAKNRLDEMPSFLSADAANVTVELLCYPPCRVFLLNKVGFPVETNLI
jgi:hypothetical protein